MENFALAHQISLIDVGGPEYTQLRNVISAAADALAPLIGPGLTVQSVRNVLRSLLHPEDQDLQLNDVPPVHAALENMVDHLTSEESTFLAMTTGGLILLAREAEETGRFLEYARNHPRHDVNIHWSRQSMSTGQRWWICPAANEEAYKLTFRLPSRLAAYVVVDGVPNKANALQVKDRLMSNMTVYHQSDGDFRIFVLRYDRATAQTNAYD